MKRSGLIATTVVALWLIFTGGCAWFQKETPAPQPTSSQTASSGASVAPAPMFYDFPDIPVPGEIKLQRDDSTVFQAGGVKTGLLVFKGRVDPQSLINFFKVSLAREKWTLKGSIRYRKSLLLFQKENRFCVIHIYERRFSTWVEIYVVPTFAAGSPLS